MDTHFGIGIDSLMSASKCATNRKRPKSGVSCAGSEELSEPPNAARSFACEFRRRHLEDFKGLFMEVVRVAREMGLSSFGKLSIDGTKVCANASKRKAMSTGRMVEEERRLKMKWKRC